MEFEHFSDEQLIELYRNGEEKAVDELFNRYKGLVKMKTRKLYLVGGDSDDLIQEGMIGLYKAMMGYDPGKYAAFSTFAGLCIDRQIINAISASNRKKNAPLNTYVSFELPASQDEDNELKLVDVLNTSLEQNPENLYIDKEFTDSLESRIKKSLSSYERKVLDLYLEGNDYIQISKITGKSPKSVDNAIQRIRSKAISAQKVQCV